MSRRNRWNTIDSTRKKLAKILTEYVRAVAAEGTYSARGVRSGEIDLVVYAKDISSMRLVGKVRFWEDAHSWEALSTNRHTGNPGMGVYSYDTMSEIVKAGAVEPIGTDGEVVAKIIERADARGSRRARGQRRLRR